MNPRNVALVCLRRIRTIGVSIVASLLLSTGLCAAVVFTVNSTDDGADVNPGDGICSTTPAPPYVCTLRAAVMEANRAPNAGATILLPAGHYILKIFPDVVDGEEKGDINLLIPPGYSPGPTTISGAGAATTTIDANGIDRVLNVSGGRQATISGVSMINGVTQSNGGGISTAASSLALTDCTISDNTTTGAATNGGGIYNTGTLVATHVVLIRNKAAKNGGGTYNGGIGSVGLARSTLSLNLADTGDGGSIFNSSGTVNVNQSTVNGTSGGDGGGIANSDFLFLTNSTIAQCSSELNGGGIANHGTVNVYNSTVADNIAAYTASATGTGGGIYNYAGGTFNLRNSVVAGNWSFAGTVAYDDCKGTLGSYGRNRFWVVTGCSVNHVGPGGAGLLVSLAELGALRDNGGPTETIALAPPSDMIDGAEATVGCVDQNGVTLAVDQRGRQRAVGVRCDIGAFEYDPDVIFFDGFQ